jgi:hypothetical protein
MVMDKHRKFIAPTTSLNGKGGIMKEEVLKDKVLSFSLLYRTLNVRFSGIDLSQTETHSTYKCLFSTFLTI